MERYANIGSTWKREAPLGPAVSRWPGDGHSRSGSGAGAGAELRGGVVANAPLSTRDEEGAEAEVETRAKTSRTGTRCRGAPVEHRAWEQRALPPSA
jgi:hypothetical protein